MEDMSQALILLLAIARKPEVIRCLLSAWKNAQVFINTSSPSVLADRRTKNRALHHLQASVMEAGLCAFTSHSVAEPAYVQDIDLLIEAIERLQSRWEKHIRNSTHSSLRGWEQQLEERAEEWMPTKQEDLV
jgi:hypothetical protein